MQSNDLYKIDKGYFWQVVNYFLTLKDLESLDFVLYNPDFYDKDMQMYIITLTREDLRLDIMKAEEDLKQFRKEWKTLFDKIKG